MRRLLLRLYPRSWRERYGEELLDLLDDTGLGPREAVDLARAGIVQRAIEFNRAMRQGGAEMVIGPAWRHPTGWALGGAMIMLPTTLFVGLSYLTYELGLAGLASIMEPVNDAINGARPLDLLLILAPLVALLAAIVPLGRLELRRGGEADDGADRDDGRGTEAVLRLRLRRLNLGVALVAVVVGGFLIAHILVETVLQIGP